MTKPFVILVNLCEIKWHQPWRCGPIWLQGRSSRRHFARRNSGRGQGEPAGCAQTGAGVPARSGRKGPVTKRRARADRVCRGMKLRDLERHLRARGCVLFREGGRTRSGSVLPTGRSPACSVAEKRPSSGETLFWPPHEGANVFRLVTGGAWVKLDA